MVHKRLGLEEMIADSEDQRSTRKTACLSMHQQDLTTVRKGKGYLPMKSDTSICMTLSKISRDFVLQM